MTTVHGGGPRMESGVPDASDKSGELRGGCGRFLLGWLLAAGLWAYLLHGFVTTHVLIALTVLGPPLAIAGLYLTVGAFRHALTSVWYLGAFVVGLLLAGGGAMTLAPAAPASVLVTTSTGWDVLEHRLERLYTALEADDLPLARRLVDRGLGDAEPPGRGGQPLVHGLHRVDRLAALLAGGLDPDARDDQGRTLLFRTWDPAIARVLLDAGADPNAPDEDGTTPLMAAGDKPPELVRLLVEAGGDVRAEHDRGRTDWLVARESAATSAITPDERPIRRGAPATLEIRLVNDTGADRLLDVRAHLNEAALFVEASHDGRIDDPRRLHAWQTVRWPLLTQPAHSEGRLLLRILPRTGPEAGDVSIDVSVSDRIGQTEDVLQIHEARGAGEQPAGPVLSDAVPLAVAVTLALAVGLWLLQRGRTRAAAAARPRAVARVIAGSVALICGGMAVLLVAEGLEPFVRFDEARCTILDRRALPRTSGPVSVPGMDEQRRLGRARLPPRRPARFDVPLAAVRIDGGQGPVFAAGFAAGMMTRTVHELRHFPLGATVSCWVDPNDSASFTLTRQPGVSAIIASAVLGILALTLAAGARRLRRPAGDDGVRREEEERIGTLRG